MHSLKARICLRPIASTWLAGALLVGGSTALLAGNPYHQAPDNTAVNKADRNTEAPNADKAKNNLSDRELMAHIRRDVVKDKSLSTYAHNVKIVATSGKVTLRGPVKTEDEKKAIEEHATKYAGSGNVTNELTIKGS